jgi:peroxiredoxin
MKKMKTTISWALVLSCVYACQTAQPKQQQASIEADIKGLTDSVVYISGLKDDPAKSDTVPVKDGKFSWSGAVTDPRKIFIGTSKQYMEMFMENAAVKVNGTVDSFYYSKVTGSPTQDEYIAFQESIKDISDGQWPLYQELHVAKDEKVKAVLETRIDSFRMAKRARIKDYVQQHPASAVSVSLIADMAMMGEFAPLDSLYRQLDPKARETVAGQKLGERLVVLKRSSLGQPIKDFTQNDLEGKPVKLSEFKGKYVFVDFWASWCGPCRAENPNVLRAYNAFKDKNFAVLGVSLDSDGDKWKEAVQKDGMPWKQISDLKGYNNEIAEYYGIQAIPSSFLLDTNGVIIAKDLRGTQLHAKLKEILQ